MSPNQIKRKKIFDAYIHQLSILKTLESFNPTVEILEDKYICPLCLNYFDETDLDQTKDNPLTLEDAPPKALGGKANTLTCKRCNNDMGRVIDSQLSLRMKEFEAHKFLPDSKYEVRIVDGDEKFQGTIETNKDGKITVLHENRNNNPNKLKEFIDGIEKDKEVKVEFRLKSVNEEYLSHSLLKTIYMMVFEKLGYSAILHEETYSRIRRQLHNPDKDIYGFKFWRESDYPKEVKGVNLILEKHLESFLAIFDLISDNSSTTVAGFLPRPPTNMPNLERMMNYRKRMGYSQYIDAAHLEPKVSFITDSEDIISIVKLMNNESI